VAADDHVEALIRRVDGELVGDLRRDLRQRGAAPPGDRDHRRRDVGQHHPPGLPDATRSRQARAPWAGGDVEHRVPGTDPRRVEQRLGRGRHVRVDEVRVALPVAGHAVPHLGHGREPPTIRVVDDSGGDHLGCATL